MLSDDDIEEIWASDDWSIYDLVKHIEVITRNTTLDEVAQDVKFLMSFVDYLNVDDVPEGLDPTFYHTLTQSGDEKLAEQVKAIKQKYHIVRQMKEGDDGTDRERNT